MDFEESAENAARRFAIQVGELKAEVESLRQQLAEKTAVICGMKERILAINTCYRLQPPQDRVCVLCNAIWPQDSNFIHTDDCLWTEVLNSKESPTCPHVQEVERLTEDNQRLRGAIDEECGYHRINNELIEAKAQLAQVREALKEAGEAVCSEYCSTDHSRTCNKIAKALSQKE